MPRAKAKNLSGLGNSLMNDRFGGGRGSDRRRTSAVVRTNHGTGEQYITNDRKEADWVKMRSVTEQGALDEFLATAELAGTDFTAQKMNNVKIIHTDQKNPFLLSASEEKAILGKHKTHRAKLTVPRRPKWDESTTADQLHLQERESYMSWRRSLAELQQTHDLLLTPFERNLEVWRQLWRVIERSDLVVQIVDARNPLVFRSDDLEAYVKEIDPKKANLLLINKADMMTEAQRKAWASYLKKTKIPYRFFSARLANELQTALDEDEEDDTAAGIGSSATRVAPPATTVKPAHDGQSDSEDNISGSEDDLSEEEGGVQFNRAEKRAPAAHNSSGEEDSEEDEEDEDSDNGEADNSGEITEEDIRILSVEELEGLFLQHAPTDGDTERKLQVGLVGYPNVGKSSTINALIGAKKVSVSATPGKTKHFQTIHLSDRVVLCDCPGLVFPNFATMKADLVCNGVLPIDQMREATGPVGLVAKRIPQRFLEAIYGIHIKTRAIEEGGTGVPTAEELLSAYARARGFTTQGLGQPDQSRAARYILKDYVNGKLLYCMPPPGPIDPTEFNRELYDELHLPEKRRAALAASMDTLSLAETDVASISTEAQAIPLLGSKSEKLDKGFFGPGGAGAGHLRRPFNYKFTEQGRAEAKKNISNRKARTLIALEKGIDPQDVQLGSSKKHFKGGARGVRGKNRGQIKDDDDF